MGGPVGLILSGQELDYLGFKWVFVTSILLGAACVMYSLIWLRNDTHTYSDAYKNLLDKEAYKNGNESPNEFIPFEDKFISPLIRYIKVIIIRAISPLHTTMKYFL